MVTAPTPPPKIFLSLGIRVAVPIVLLLLSVAGLVYLGLVRQSQLTLLNSKEVAAEMVVKLTSVSVMPAVVFGDPQEMQRAVSDLARNPDVSDVELWGFESSELGASEGLLAKFHRGGGRSLGRPTSGRSQRWREADSVRVVEPVVNIDNKVVAALSARFSTQREAEALARLSRQILIVSAGTTLCLALLILLLIHRIVVRPVERLGLAAERLARGEGHQAHDSSSRVEDEVGRLGKKFEEMAAAVRDREMKLGVRNAELKLILDSVEQGFLTARVDGTLLEEHSAIVEKWVGPLPADVTVWSLAGLIEPHLQSWMETAWQQLTESVLPLEVTLEQLPKRLDRAGQHFSLAYHPVLVDGELKQVVIVLTDVTAEVEHQRALAEQHEFAALVDQFVRDRRAFHDFWEEASLLVHRIVAKVPETPASLQRDVHTLKGNARYFGLNRVSALCHELESAMQDRGEHVLTARERAELQELWESLRQRIEPLMNGATVFVEVSRDEYERLLDAVCRRRPMEELEELVRGLRREPVRARLERARGILDDACKKLSKSPALLEIREDGLRVPPGPWAPFWSVLPHLLSNAVDHGLESDDERVAAGKPVPGSVSLSAHLVDGEVVFELRDDGRGIDWERVRELAAAKGLPHRTPAELEEALFVDGFSLKREVSQISGRGVGLAAVRQVVTAMGGKIELHSAQGAGTSWRFRFPTGALTSDPDAEPRVEALGRTGS